MTTNVRAVEHKPLVTKYYFWSSKFITTRFNILSRMQGLHHLLISVSPITANSHSLTAAHNWLWVVAPSRLADPQQQPMPLHRQQWVRCPTESGSSR